MTGLQVYICSKEGVSKRAGRGRGPVGILPPLALSFHLPSPSQVVFQPAFTNNALREPHLPPP